MKKLVVKSLVALLTLGLLTTGCSANKAPAATTQYPTKPVTVIVPFAAGGGSDLMVRAMEKLAPKYLGQPLVVVNKPGGAATIGWNELAASPPDGYTLGVTNISLTLQPLYGPTKYNYPVDLEAIAQATTIPIFLVVKSDSEFKTLADFIKYAKQNPGKIKYSHAGLGQSTHVAAELFAKNADIKIEQVPFSGGSEALTTLLGGHVQAMMASAAEVTNYIKDGKLRALGVAEEKRLTDPVTKDIPTFKEQGVDTVFQVWQGIGATKGLPEDVKNKLAEAFKGIINDPEFKSSATNLSMNVEYLGPSEFSAKWKSESERFKKLVIETGIAEKIASQKK